MYPYICVYIYTSTYVYMQGVDLVETQESSLNAR